MEAFREDETGVATKIWINGAKHDVVVLWATATHAEVILEDDPKLFIGQSVTLIFRGYISLPMKVRAIESRQLFLSFIQRPHHSVIDVIKEDMRAAGVPQLRDYAEEHSVPSPNQDDDPCDEHEAQTTPELTPHDQDVVDNFSMRVRTLELVGPPLRKGRRAPRFQIA